MYKTKETNKTASLSLPLVFSMHINKYAYVCVLRFCSQNLISGTLMNALTTILT